MKKPRSLFRVGAKDKVKEGLSDMRDYRRALLKDLALIDKKIQKLENRVAKHSLAMNGEKE